MIYRAATSVTLMAFRLPCLIGKLQSDVYLALVLLTTTEIPVVEVRVSRDSPREDMAMIRRMKRTNILFSCKAPLPYLRCFPCR